MSEIMTEQPSLERDIRLIVLDVDHTLLTNKSELTSRNEHAIAAAMEMGVKVILATGKNYGACKDLIQQLKLDAPGIFTQGLSIHEANGTIRHEQTLDNEIARRVITYAEDRGYAVVGYSQGHIYARANNPYVEELHTRWKEIPAQIVGPLQNMLGKLTFNKLLLMSAGDERKIKALRWQLSTQLNGSARLMSGGVPHQLEILPPGASKGNALRALLKEMRIDPKHVMAIGDAENDIEMLQIAGLGIAVANAQQGLKDVADELTASNEDHGVAKAIEKHILGSTEAAKPEADEKSAAKSPMDTNAASVPDDDKKPSAVKPEDAVLEADSDDDEE
jgi:Cof subfamily protein (haloacid dehalogenase superfamily)